MKKAAVPILLTPDPQLRAFAEAVKHNVDAITGQQQNAVKLTSLPATATLAQVIEQINLIKSRIDA